MHFVRFSTRQALQGLWRNGVMTFAATFTMILMLVLLSALVIVITGQRDPAIENKMRALGVHDYFNKPVHFGQLRDAIGKYIRLIERNWCDLDAIAARD